ncbi:uncharacterized protein LOC134246532 [Saccostrea cucullata]|uniref:uncharacterized protein LOC134246532 n=1 Tax=Saccostrea cuccullata TaxID=36930 RepID=UPI002ED4C8B6
MSSMYYRVDPPRPKSPTFGMGTRTAKEIKEITERLVKSTYERKLATQENKQVNNYEHLLESGNRKRLPSACRDRNIRPPPSRESDGRRYTDRDFRVLMRRLMRPTMSASAKYQKQDEDTVDKIQNLKEGKIVRGEKSDREGSAKSVRRISRPTTASRAKTFECHLCYEHNNKKADEEPDAFDYEYSDSRAVPKEELDYIVERVAMPTCSSAKGGRKCAKTPVYIDEVKIREQLPLLSGLGRSKNVQEITNRLHKRRYKYTPMATEITVFS